MLANYLKIAVRNLWRNKSYTFINLFGLSIGLAASLLIIMYILFEFSYDQFHKNKDSIYRISVLHKKEGKPEYDSPVYTPPIGPALKREFPEIKNFVRISTPRSVYIFNKDQAIRVDQTCYADTVFFNLFSFELTEGNPDRALSEPYSIVLTESTAKILFGQTNPMGRIVNINRKDDFHITGIVRDPPPNSSITFNALISFTTLYHQSDTYMGWNGGNQYITFVELGRHSRPKQVEEKLPDFMWRNINKEFSSIGVSDEPYLQPLNKMHVYYDMAGNNLLYILFLSATAFLILIMACVNFVNLTTALSVKRAREVGMRKVLGAGKNQIIRQFLTESVFLSFTALILAVFFIELIFPVYKNLIGKEIILAGFWQIKYVFAVLFFTFLIGFIAGSYPAFYISSVRIAQTVKGVFQTKKTKRGFRNFLVVLQFIISTILIICTVLLQKQLHYMNNKDLGFRKDNILVIRLSNPDIQSKSELLKQELSNLPEIQEVSACSAVPIRGFTSNGYFPEGFQSPMMIHVVDVDEQYLELFEIPVVMGRNFSKEFTNDKEAYLINETLAKQLGWTNPIGKTIRRGGNHKVIGVVKDFHFATLYDKIEPLIITRHPFANRFNYIVIKLNSSDLPRTIAAIQSKWKKIAVATPFEYYFLDDAFNQLYRFEQRFKNIFFAFNILAILIAIFGLYSLASYTTEQRTKEVGVRKVMGASVSSIIFLFSKNFALLVIMADVAAIPAAWYVMSTVLQNFAYRVSMSWFIFAGAALFSLFLAVAVVTIQSLHTALMNPVDTLRYE